MHGCGRFGQAVTVAIVGSALFGQWAGAVTHYVWMESPSATSPYTNWATAAHTIQEAVDAALAGEMVVVTNGNYDITSQIELTNAITVRSANGPSVTMVDAGGGNTRVFYIPASAVLDGFTVTRGKPSGGTTYGAGVYMDNDPLLANCIISYNTNLSWSAFGGGVYIDSGGGRVENCTIVHNDGKFGGGGLYIKDKGFVRDCLIKGNRANLADGGGIWQEVTTGGLVENCVIVENVANGASDADGGGVYSVSTHTLVFRNCEIARNYARDDGGGACNGNVLFDCCTIASNTAVDRGGGLYPAFRRIYTRNSVVWTNVAADAVDNNWVFYSQDLTYSCTEPLPSGLGCISDDPLFMDVPGGDYTLQATSPCIERGTNQTWMTGALDLAGNDRLKDHDDDTVAIVDMGAYEFTPAPVLPKGAYILVR